jgi:endo-1,4-beta-xylanase
MTTTRLIFLVTAGTIFLSGCAENAPAEEQEATLKSAFADNFHIGAALSRRQIEGSDTAGLALALREFNTITAENNMKWMYLHPAADSFDFKMADKFVALGEQNGMAVVGHTLVWHNQLAPWVKEVADSAAMMAVLDQHIRTVVGRYSGRMHGWDVVNEALNEDGTLRRSLFYETTGGAYLKKAFEAAAATDPTAELYYNDYNLCQPAKRAGAIELVKNLQTAGAKIDGIGIQAHWGLDYPPLEEIEKSITGFAALGLKVMFTELDVTVLPNPPEMEGAEVSQRFENDATMNPFPDGLPDSMQVKLAQRYEDIFNLFLKHEDKISRVTFWGVHDGQSWLNNWPIRGRTNYPLLFDRKQLPKPAYFNVMKLKQPKVAKP